MSDTKPGDSEPAPDESSPPAKDDAAKPLPGQHDVDVEVQEDAAKERTEGGYT